MRFDLCCSRSPNTNNPNPHPALADNRGQVSPTNRADHHVSLVQSVLGAEKDMLRSPECLRFNKVDPVLGLVALALSRVKLKIHDVDHIRAIAAGTTKHQSADH